MPNPSPPLLPDDDPAEGLRIARARFIRRFPERSQSIAILLDRIHQLGSEGPAESVRQLAHRLAGTAGMLGLPNTGAAAGRLEAIMKAVVEHGFDRRLAHDALTALRQAFMSERGLEVAGVLRPSTTVLLVGVAPSAPSLAAALTAAGGVVTRCEREHDALAAARVEQPTVIACAVNGATADAAWCRRLKRDPDLTAVPLLVVGTDGVRVGHAFAPDEPLVQTGDVAEALRTIGDLGRTAAARDAVPHPLLPDALGYEAFLLCANEVLARTDGTVAVVTAPADRLDAVLTSLLAGLRRRDLVAQYDDLHVLAFVEGMAVDRAAARLAHAFASVPGGSDVHAGLAPAHIGSHVDEALDVADRALEEAVAAGIGVLTR